MFNLYTTFPKSSYLEYGKNFIDTFIKYWPDTIKLYVYYDGEPEFINDKVVWLDYNEECKDQKEFAERGKNIPQDSFYRGATKFSYKGFTIINHLEKNLDRYNIWMDADCITVNPITEEWLHTLKDTSCLSVLMRNTRAIETGFILTDNKHKHYNNFINTYADVYRKDIIYSLPEWHDSYVLNHVIYTCNLSYFDLSPHNEYREIHPFSTGVLGRCLDHLKGPRKYKGHSPERSIFWK